MEKNESTLIRDIEKNRASGNEVLTDLQTDDRVLARISDGIYRQPASALRELIANAYDADATEVVIRTDWPRFEKISIDDNGIGMSEKALVRLIRHIGGSAKRTELGEELLITSPNDPTKSPGGRKLIGKIGIGLFSVAQLTRTFRIITKQKGSHYRLVADVRLLTYSEETHKADVPTRTGTVRIRSVPAKDTEHGTKIELLNIQPAARDFLQSKDTWTRIYTSEEEGSGAQFSTPAFHVGRLKTDGTETIDRSEQLPWKESDSPEIRFRKLVGAIHGEREKRTANPKLEEAFDRYFQTMWSLALSLPLPYLNKTHPFDIPKEKLPKVYLLSNNPKGQATELSLKPKETLRKNLSLRTESPPDFRVLFDSVELRRPLDVTTIDDPERPPLLFVGKFEPDLSGIPEEIAGGRALSIESYFVWTPKVVPVEHIGMLVRIADASGTLFDSTYFSYQVAERVRLRQLSGELFAVHGLDAALNIDRESFNFGHTHAKIVTGWVHRALRQIANAQKKLQSNVRADAREAQEAETQKRIWQVVKETVGGQPQRVQFVDDESAAAKVRAKGKNAIVQTTIFEGLPTPTGAAQKTERSVVTVRIQAIATLLQEYGLWDELDYEQQQKFLHSLARILESA